MLTISPSTTQTTVVGVPICFEGTATVSIPQTDLDHLHFSADGANWTYDTTNWVFHRSGGTNGTFVGGIGIPTDTVHGLQPWYIQACNSSFATPGVPNNNVHWYIGAITDTGERYVIEVMKYCNNSTGSSCNAFSGSGASWVITVYANGSYIYTRSVNFNEKFYIRSDGVSLFYEHISAGILIRDAQIPLPPAKLWSFEVGAGYINNNIDCLGVFKGSYQGQIAVTWSAPTGGTITPNGNKACFQAGTTGTYQVVLDSDIDDPIEVDVIVAALNFQPEDFDCGQCVFTGDTVKFTSNGGYNGVLTAEDGDGNPVGTVLDALTWQAPGIPVTAILTYTLGSESVNCTVNVIENLKVLNVDGDTVLGLIPGDVFQIRTNYEYPDVVWENLSCPNVVTPEGYIAVPRRLNDNCFGSLDCYIRGRLVSVSGVVENTGVEGLDEDGNPVDPELNLCPNLTEGADQIYVDLRIIVDPIYPTPEFGGPTPLKWRLDTPEYKVIINEFEGGCDETYLKNPVPIQRWEVRYDGLSYQLEKPCPELPCCDEEQGFIDGYDTSYQTATRLDEFWKLVAGTSGYFTLKDFRTDLMWKRVRFDAPMERDHGNWRTTQSRNVKLVWHPCCDTEPEGGVCRHNTVSDIYPPSVPQDLAATPTAPSYIYLEWVESQDNVGIEGYELLIDGTIVDVGNVHSYYHKNLPSESGHFYQVRAYDFTHNRSNWSDEVTATAPLRDTSPPTIPDNFLYDHFAWGSNTLTFHWDESTDNVGVAGYIFLDNRGYSYNVGSNTSYTLDAAEHELPLIPGRSSYFYIRAYDVNGLKSAWSAALEFIPPAVTVSGVVKNPSDVGLRNATVTLLDYQGNSRQVITSSLGFYQFEDVWAYQTYTISAKHKSFTFDPYEDYLIEDDVTLDFEAIP